MIKHNRIFFAVLVFALVSAQAFALEKVGTTSMQVLKLPIGERERWRHGDRVPGVNSHRVDVFDRTHHDGVVGVVAHELELVLLPAQDRLLEEHFSRGALVQAIAHHANQFGAAVREAAAEAAHGE